MQTVFLVWFVFSLTESSGKKIIDLRPSRLIAVIRDVRSCDPPYGDISDTRVVLYGKHDYRISATFNIPCPPRNISKMVLVFESCDGEVRNVNNCEYFGRYTFPDGCGILNTKGQFWTPFVESFSPVPRCPVGGTYQLQNATVDIPQVPSTLKVEGRLWSWQHTSYDTNGKPLFCTQSDVIIRRVRE